jgi:cellulose synthase operon protein C
MPQPAKPGKGTLPPGAVPLAAAPGAGRGPGDPEWERDLGLALSILSDTRSPGGGDGEAVRRLTDATARHPSDVDAWEALAYVRVGRSEWVGALEAAERAVALDPGRERALGLAAVAATRLRRLDVAEGYARRALEVNPGNPAGGLQLVDILLTAERFAEAEGELRALLTRIPNQVMARTFLAVTLHQQGKAAAAQAEMELVARIDPRQAAALWRTFRARTE